MFKCFEGENTSMCEAIRQMVDEGISMGQKQGSLNEKMTIARRLDVYKRQTPNRSKYRVEKRIR